MRKLHDLNIDIEIEVRHSIMKRRQTIDPLHPAEQRDQRRLNPDHNLPRDLAQRLGKSDKLDGVAKSVIAEDQHTLVHEALTPPNALKMPLASAPDRAAFTVLSQTSVTYLPCMLEVVTPKRIGPGWEQGRIQSGTRGSGCRRPG
jgi:hypothetical protein